jgi:HK97 family phage major capsid protein
VKLEDITPTSSVTDFEAVLGNQDNIKKLMAENKFGKFVKDYANAKAAQNKDLETQVKEQVQASIQEWIKDSGGQLKRLNLDSDESKRVALAAKKSKVYNAKAPGAKIDESGHAPEDLPEFLQTIWHHANQLSNYDDLRAKQSEWKKIQNAYGSSVPADGGFLIPEVLRAEILQLAMEQSIVRSRAQIIPMSSLAVPIPTVDETSRVSSVFGGMVAYWTEEGAAATISNAKFGRVRLEAKKLTIYAEAPDELIADAPAFGAFIGVNMPKALSFEEDYSFLQGTGVGEPLGVLKGSGLISVTRDAATGINFDDVINIFTRLLPGSYDNAVWLCAPDTIGDLLRLQTVVQNVAGSENVGGGWPLWLTGSSAAGAPPLSLLGRPLIITEKVPARDSAGDLSLVDFSHYLVGDRQVMQASSSPHFKFSSDVTAYKVVERVDGRPWVNTALTPKNNSSNTLSPYVTTGVS